MTTKHISGPWKAVYVGCGDWDLNGPVTQEDWTLAAAAPELLAALIDIERTAGQPAMTSDPVRVKARAAIAKATGQE